MNMTRRDTHFWLLSGLASAVAVPLHAREDWPSRVQAALDAILPRGHGSRLTLSSYEVRPGNSLTATVELDWPPGLRRRSFEVSAQTEAALVERLLAEVRQSFADAIPDAVA